MKVRRVGFGITFNAIRPQFTYDSSPIRSEFGVPTDPIYLRKLINRQRLFSA
jgi:hypothetical protein